MPTDPKPPAATPWHTLSTADATRELGVDPATGLCAAEAGARFERHGANEIPEGRKRSAWAMLADQFADFMIGLLIVAAVISGFIGEAADAVAIVVIVALNATIGFAQEYRAERAMAALRKMAAVTARCLREGVPLVVAAARLVPGDVVVLEAGNVVPADLRLLQAVHLRTEEAALTGESVPVEKAVAALPETDLPVADRRNMAFKGTVVTYGRGLGLVVATGGGTELGRIAALLAGEEHVRTPLQKRLGELGRKLGIVAIAICAGVFALGVARGEPAALMFLTAVSLAVAAVPEALPAVVTIALALGARRMVASNALIRRLPAVEALGSTTFICSDKTGTLTQNLMRVEAAWAGGERWAPADAVPGGPAWRALFAAMALNNDARLDPRGEALGDPTEVALLLGAVAAGHDPRTTEAAQPRVAELPFDSERKRMTTFHRRAEGFVAYTKGAPERVLERCHSADPEALQQAEAMAREGLRVIAFARRRWSALPQTLDEASVEAELEFIGLAGLMDPPRPEAGEAVRLCRMAGITPVMVTGDHPATAAAIAHRLGIAGPSARVLTGRDLARLDPAALREAAREARVYARVDPTQKIAIVEALQANGEFVAMTGDGVNDAPALKRAEIGVAMGRIGTDVAREAAHMVLLDDNFASIVAAVREGRRIYDNIRKFIRFVLGGNVGEIVTILLAPLLGMPLPLLPIQILWINLVTDGLPGLALAPERAERAIMQRPPRPPRESVFARGLWQHVLWVGALMGGLSLLTQHHAMGSGNGHWQTMVFTVLTLAQMYHVLAIRSERESLLAIGLFSNPALLGAVALTFALQLAVIYVPALNEVFHTAPLSAGELAYCVGLPALVLVGVEIEKWLIRRRLIYRGA